ncbi:MAG: twin-arginine translocase TatA/TatE family subunit [Actinomycetota bacterium]|nr:twin-arginine translocase TatA/TatE family subunit [Actinomycetota bacterium]
MFSLDPAKVLVVLVVALVVLGPDKLPRAARQAGAAWNHVRHWRDRLEEEVRGAFPDLPAARTIGQAVRSPLSLLDRLADDHEHGIAAEGAARADGAPGRDDAPAQAVTAEAGAAAAAGPGTGAGSALGGGIGEATAGAAAAAGAAPTGATSHLDVGSAPGAAASPAGAPGPAGDPLTPPGTSGSSAGAARNLDPLAAPAPAGDPNRWVGDPTMN